MFAYTKQENADNFIVNLTILLIVFDFHTTDRLI